MIQTTTVRQGALEGKVALVTGASRGIGETIAVRLAMEGAHVVASARTVNEGDRRLPGAVSGTVERIRGPRAAKRPMCAQTWLWRRIANV